MFSEMDEYFKWLKKNTTSVPTSIIGWVEITMPFLDRHNDYFQIYVLKDNDDYLIEDNGFILADLIESGYELSDFYMDKIVVILKGFGISLQNKKLTTVAQLDNFPFKLNQMIQAMTVVDNLQ